MHKTLLSYPDFTKPFNIHTDTSDYQLGAVISQNNKPIVFYSKRLNPAQTRYTTTEKELLAIVETLKEFKNILVGQEIRVYADHTKLMYKSHNSARVMRWRLMIEEFGPELIYLPGVNNLVVDCLSRLKYDNNDNQTDHFALDEEDINAYPLSYKLIMKYQQKDNKLL